jgi:hypothetical protein
MKRAMLFSGNKNQNTFIGGIGVTINTPSLLATKLDIASSRISMFEVVGSEVRCRIFGSYPTPSMRFSELDGITSYIDKEGLISFVNRSFIYSTNSALTGVAVKNIKWDGVLGISDGAFSGATASFKSPLFENIILKNCTEIKGQYAMQKLYFLKLVYIGKVTSLGADALYNGVFRESKMLGTVIYCHPSLATNNAGNPDGDIQYAIDNGADIRYVANLDSPSKPTFTVVDEEYNTAIQLTNVNSSGTNTIDYYEVWINGAFNRNITASGQYVAGLTPNTSYVLTLIAVDVFYNKSLVSNSVVVSTSNVVYDDSDANAYISASTLTNSSDLESTQILVKGLKDNLLWNKIQVLYPFKGSTASQHRFNAKNPLDTNAAFRLLFSGTGTHSSLGYTGNGTNAYANTNFAVNLNANINSFGATLVCGTNNPANSGDVTEMGSTNPASATTMFRFSVKANNSNFLKYFTSYNQSIRPNMSGENDSRCILTGVRLADGFGRIFKNGIKVSTTSSAMGGVAPTGNVFIGASNQGGPFGYSNQRIQIAIIHEGLTDAEVTTLHSIIDLSETIAGRKTW